MEIIILRHAETKGNLERRYIGLTDEPLSETGISHAESVGVFPEVTRVITSTLQRTKQTAHILFPNAELVPCVGLEEMHFGEFEGKNFEEMANDPKYQAWVDGNGIDNCPGGECRAEFIDRSCETFKRVLRDAYKRGDERLIIVAHCGTLMAVTSCFSCPPCEYFDCRVSHCEGFRFLLSEFDEENPKLTDREFIKDLNLC